MNVRYGKTFSLGNYQTHRIDLEVENVKKENVEQVFKWLTDQVQRLHELKVKVDAGAGQQMAQEQNKVPTDMSFQ